MLAKNACIISPQRRKTGLLIPVNYDRTYKYVIKRFNSICDLAKYLGYNKGNETTLGKYCRGELPMPNKGKLKNYIISHERL